MPRHSGALEDSERRDARKRKAVERAFEKLRKYDVDCRRIVFFKKQKKRSGGYGVVQRAELYQSAYLPSWLASRLNGPPQVVAVKQIRMSAADDSFDLKRAFTKELLVWSGLKDHPGIAKFIGYYADFDRSEAWLLSPWEPHGNITDFTAQRHLEVPEKLSLVYDTIDALTFLHQLTPPVCHGDIKSANVLVNANCRAVFCDFGLARIFEDSGFQRLETSTGFKGSIRWCSPELLDGGPRTPSSDVYAWAWLVWEIMTGEMPYQETVAEYSIIRKIFESPRPQVNGESRLSDCLQLWELMTRCWAAGPEERPTSRMCRTTVTFLPRCAPSPEGSDPLSPSAELLENLGELESWKGNYEEGLAHLKTALELYQKKGYDKGIANVLRKQVLVFNRHSRYNEAIELGPLALAKLRALDDDLGTADVLCRIGCSLVMVKMEEATPYLSEALKKFRVHGHDVGAVICLERLANIHKANGHYDKALSTLDEALALAGQSGDKLGEVGVLEGQAYAFRASGDFTKAVEIFTTACDIARRIGDGFGTCECLDGIATIKMTLGSYEAAEEMFQESISVARSINYGLMLARSTAKLGGTLEKQGRLSEAAITLENGCSLFQEFPFPDTDRAEAAENLARVKNAQGDVEARLFWLGQAIAEHRKLEGWCSVSRTLEEMGTVQLNMQRYEEAALSFEAAWIIYHELEWVWSAKRMASYIAGIPKTAMQVIEAC